MTVLPPQSPPPEPTSATAFTAASLPQPALGQHFVDDRDLDTGARLALLETAWALKHAGLDPALPLARKHVALVMSKPSLRTRTSFTVAIRDLGGDLIEVGAHNTKLGHGEDLVEWAAVLGRMVHAIVARLHGHDELIALARYSGVPVVNALTDALHPCQALADAFTVWEQARLRGAPGSERAASYFAQPQRWAYVGDGNNVAHSLMLTAASLGVTLAIAAPPGRSPDPELVASARAMHPAGVSGVHVGHDAGAAVDGATVVYTDTWVSMGQEGELGQAEVERLFAPYRVDGELMARAMNDAIFMHCLPAEPGREVTVDVLRGPASVVLDQAENRMWTTKALLARHVFVPAWTQPDAQRAMAEALMRPRAIAPTVSTIDAPHT
jgi:ornithine carbamoyltransferase